MPELTDEQKKAKAIKDAKEVLTKRDELIKKTYYDGSGYNSQAITLRDVRKKDNTITQKYVESWFDANVLTRKGSIRIASSPHTRDTNIS